MHKMTTNQTHNVPKDAVQVSPVPCDFLVNDIVEVTNGYGVKFSGHRVTGFRPNVDPDFLPDKFIYLDWDCFWFPVAAASLKLERRETETEPEAPATKLVRVTLSAFTRLEYSEVIEVPADFSDDDMQVLATRRYDEIDGGDFRPDPDYWEKGSVTCDNEDSTLEPDFKLVDDELIAVAEEVVEQEVSSGLASYSTYPRLPVVVVEKNADGDIASFSSTPVHIVFLDEDKTGGIVIGDENTAEYLGRKFWVNAHLSRVEDVVPVLTATGYKPADIGASDD
jgi:hypothetical protein